MTAYIVTHIGKRILPALAVVFLPFCALDLKGTGNPDATHDRVDLPDRADWDVDWADFSDEDVSVDEDELDEPEEIVEDQAVDDGGAEADDSFDASEDTGRDDLPPESGFGLRTNCPWHYKGIGEQSELNILSSGGQIGHRAPEPNAAVQLNARNPGRDRDRDRTEAQIRKWHPCQGAETNDVRAAEP